MKHKATSAQDAIREIAETCLMMRARMLGRVVSALYDDQLRPFGLNASQCSLLVAIGALGSARRADIARLYRQDRSTLTRNLQVMLANGWIAETARDADGRGRPVVLTPPGNALLQQALPAWRRAQDEAKALLGEAGAAAVKGLGDALIGFRAA